MDAMQFSDDELNDLTNELSNQTGFQSADIARTLLQNACEYRSTELSMPLTKQECIESVKHLLTLLAKIKKCQAPRMKILGGMLSSIHLMQVLWRAYFHPTRHTQMCQILRGLSLQLSSMSKHRG